MQEAEAPEQDRYAMEGSFVGVIDLRALSEKLGISEAELQNAIFDGAPALPSPEEASLQNPYPPVSDYAVQRRGSPRSDVGAQQAGHQGEEPSESEVRHDLELRQNERVAEVALVTAARRRQSLGVKKPPELLEVAGRSVLVHSLLALDQAGVRVAIVLVGACGQEIIAAVQREYQPMPGPQKRMRIEFLDLGESWEGSHADSILEARSKLAFYCGGAHFPRPFLLAVSDRIYEPNLLRHVVNLWGLYQRQESNFCVMDDPARARSAPTTRSSTAVRILAEQQAEQHRSFRVKRVGRDLPIYNGIELGLFRLNGHQFFSEMERLQALRPPDPEGTLSSGPDLILAKILDNLASNGHLFALPVESYKYASFETPEQIKLAKHELTHGFLPLLPSVAPDDELGESSQQFSVEEQSREAAPLPRVAIVPIPDEGEAPMPSEDFKPAAILPRSLDPAVRQLADQEDVALFVHNPEEEGALPKSALLLPARLERAVPLRKDDASAFRCGPSRPLQLLQAQVGLELPPDVTGVQFSVREEGADQSGGGVERTLVATVQREVPVIGWVILAVATLTASSSVLVIKNTTEGVPESVVQAWRYLAATLAALPIAAINTVRDMREEALARQSNGSSQAMSETTPLLPSIGQPCDGSNGMAAPPSPFRRRSTMVQAHFAKQKVGRGAKTALAGCVVSYWICNFAFMVAIRTTSHPEVVALFANLAPLVIVLARMTGLSPGGFPTLIEIGGCVAALAGAAICTFSRGGHGEDGADASSSGLSSERLGDLIAILWSLVASAFHAIYTILTKVARKEISAPTLHIWMQGGSAALALIGLVLVGDLHLSFDPNKGAFGFLYPSNSRLLAWSWMGIGVDTLGTLGYTAAMKYVKPLMVVMAAILQVRRSCWNGSGTSACLTRFSFCIDRAPCASSRPQRWASKRRPRWSTSEARFLCWRAASRSPRCKEASTTRMQSR